MSATNVWNKIFCGLLVFGLVFGAQKVFADEFCPDCLPDNDGSIFPGGSCENCDHPKSNKAVRIVDGTRVKHCPDCPVPVFETRNYPLAQPRYKSNAANRDCCDLAPFALTHVDFRLQNQEGYSPYTNHVGNYRFRIFGCRRYSKKAMLNHGRVIQKDMAFHEIFRKSADKCYKIMDMPDACLEDEGVKIPEYVLTAEITNFFMNICDEYDWDKAHKNDRRNGTAEMTVTWRLMNPSQTKVLWKGVTSGYAELPNGIYEAEVKLAEMSFADAVARLSSLPGFEYQLQQRVSPEVMVTERAALVAFDAKFNPGKCSFVDEIAYMHSCAYAPQSQCPAIARPDCPCAQIQTCICDQPVCNCPQPACSCAVTMMQPKVEEFVDVKTKTKTVEQKIITTTRVETPQPVCRQVCRPMCQSQKKVVKKVETIETIETITEECPVRCEQQCEQPKCRKVCTETCIVGEIKDDELKCKTRCTEDCGAPKSLPDSEVVTSIEEISYIQPQVEENGGGKVENVVVASQVEETGGVEVENIIVASQVEEAGGVVDDFRKYENCIDENGNVISDGSCTIVDDSWVDLEGYAVDAKLCIVDRPPYSELSPENMLKIRSSVVEISNAKGKKGMGLLISDSFILTSAKLVNKLQNTYDVKTINGEVLQAKAVRVNPSKNTALMHLNKPVAYTPIALNLDLPAIDQEGFISLGLLNNDGKEAKNYMDDEGRIYGYRYSDTLGTEIIVDTLVQEVSVGSVLIDSLGTVNGISNSAKQTEDGMDLFIPTETALRSVGLTICERLYDKKSPWQKIVYKPVTEKIQQETNAPEEMPEVDRK